MGQLPQGPVTVVAGANVMQLPMAGFVKIAGLVFVNESPYTIITHWQSQDYSVQPWQAAPLPHDPDRSTQASLPFDAGNPILGDPLTVNHTATLLVYTFPDQPPTAPVPLTSNTLVANLAPGSSLDVTDRSGRLLGGVGNLPAGSLNVSAPTRSVVGSPFSTPVGGGATTQRFTVPSLGYGICVALNSTGGGFAPTLTVRGVTTGTYYRGLNSTSGAIGQWIPVSVDPTNDSQVDVTISCSGAGATLTAYITALLFPVQVFAANDIGQPLYVRTDPSNIPFVQVSDIGSPSGNATAAVTTTGSWQTLFASLLVRKGLTVWNNTNDNAFVAFATAAGLFMLPPGATYIGEMPVFRGAILVWLKTATAFDATQTGGVYGNQTS